MSIMYSNIQGVTGKKTSLLEILETLNPDICLLAETMTANFNLEGCKVITPHKSVGQNVAIVLRNKLRCQPVVKIYEPNETINMIGVRFEMKNNNLRFYTAHLKQCSVNSRDDIQEQFEEIKVQFQQATAGGEAMMLVCDANVHVGNKWIKGCTENEDWGGRMLMETLNDEGLVLINSMDICEGVVTRIDPRNGTCTTLDLAICNSYMCEKVRSMKIDEEGLLKPTRYGRDKITITDHNTITIKLMIEKIVKPKAPCFYQVRSAEGRELFVQNIRNDECLESIFVDGTGGLDVEFDKLKNWWRKTMDNSFKKVSKGKNVVSGICEEVKELIAQERWIKKNVLTNPERGRMIFQVRQKIKEMVSRNRSWEMEESVKKVLGSSNPYSEVFKIRKNMKKKESIAFPLKNTKGNIQVDKCAIDSVVYEHFQNVFKQIEVPEDDIWKKYWKCIDDVYDILGVLNSGEESGSTKPIREEIHKLISSLKSGKAVRGDMTIDLVKLGGERLWDVIYRCICWCYEAENVPLEMRIEKMILLYKNAGEIDILDNYRGIFLRHVILSLLQKWLYSQNAGTLDENGSELAFGGRVERCVQEALLIVKLVQDHALWTGEKLFIKFMDVQKFFDSMNFRKALIDAFLSGLDGKAWKMYDILNKFKTCVPFTPLGDGIELDMNEVFVQGSADAVLMAWNTIDMRNKSRKDSRLHTGFVIEGIELSGITFIDDIVEFARSEEEILERLVDDEVFQRSNRLKFKPSKCKIVLINAPVDTVREMFELNNEQVEVVLKWKYLGTVVDNQGRTCDFDERLKGAKGVGNEIVQICKSDELSTMRLRYVNLLIQACLHSKVKFGSEFWAILCEKDEVRLDSIQIKVVKRIMELPYATPSAAVSYEFGLIDLSLTIKMEKVVFAVKTLKSPDERVAKQLLRIMIEKKVPGFASEVLKTCTEVFGIELLQLVEFSGDVRDLLKNKVIEIQRNKLARQMLELSKTDRLLLNSFKFDGKRKKYLDLPFPLAKSIFMVRCRMLPTKDNFPGRWNGSCCNICGKYDTDEHIFSCPGFVDILGDSVTLELFFRCEDLEVLETAAEKMVRVIERLNIIQELEISE